ncbi:MAG TPA: hypothetical protein VGM10_20565 [Actinocrinis sp.]|jgi:hypothetical protein
MRVLMWEAKGDADGMIAWWRGEVDPTLPEGCAVELFRSADRLVAILRPVPPPASGWRVPDPPAQIVDRPPHAWPFDAVEDEDEVGTA